MFKKKIAEVAVYLLCTVCGGLRGEEVPLISLKGLITFWKRTQIKSTPHIMLTLLGRFKGETGERWHLMPIADETRTKMPVRKWFTRLLYSIVEIEKRKTGWLFTTNNRRGKMADLVNGGAIFWKPKRGKSAKVKNWYGSFSFNLAQISLTPPSYVPSVVHTSSVLPKPLHSTSLPSLFNEQSTAVFWCRCGVWEGALLSRCRSQVLWEVLS